MAKNYYNILEVPCSASEQELRSAYKNQAKRWHPDKNLQQSGEAHEKFNAVREAYEVLGHRETREAYDLKCTMQSYHFPRMDPSLYPRNFEKFQDQFKSAGFADRRSPPKSQSTTTEAAPPQPSLKRKSSAISHSCICSLEDLYRGCTKRMRITRKVMDNSGTPTFVDKDFEIKVNPGWRAGTQIIFNNEGDIEPNHEPGDIIFMVEEQPHPTYQRDVNNLCTVQKISLAQSLTGFKFEVKKLDNSLQEIEIDDIVNPSTQIVIPGAGMPISKKPNQFGDLIVNFQIQFPTFVHPQDKQNLKNILLRQHS